MQALLTSNGPVLIGYHGCDRETGERVLPGEVELLARTNDYDWLGEGIYFWENDPLRAQNWARTVMKHGKRSRAKVTEPFVIGAVIKMGNCLDLMQAESIRLVKDAYTDLSDLYEIFNRKLPENRMIKGELVLRRLIARLFNRCTRSEKKADCRYLRLSALLSQRACLCIKMLASSSVRTSRFVAAILGYFRVKKAAL